MKKDKSKWTVEDWNADTLKNYKIAFLIQLVAFIFTLIKVAMIFYKKFE